MIKLQRGHSGGRLKNVLGENDLRAGLWQLWNAFYYPAQGALIMGIMGGLVAASFFGFFKPFVIFFTFICLSFSQSE